MICCSLSDTYEPVSRQRAADSTCEAEKLQHEPQTPWSFTGPTAPDPRQSTVPGTGVNPAARLHATERWCACADAGAWVRRSMGRAARVQAPMAAACAALLQTLQGAARCAAAPPAEHNAELLV